MFIKENKRKGRRGIYPPIYRALSDNKIKRNKKRKTPLPH